MMSAQPYHWLKRLGRRTAQYEISSTCAFTSKSMNEREMTMKTAQLLAAALILSASVSAMAQQSSSTAAAPAATQESKGIAQGKTRAEVIAELKQAEAEGKAMPTGFVAYDAPAKAGTTSGNTAIARK